MSKTKPIFHEFDPVLYPFKVWIIINKDIRILSSRFVSTSFTELDYGDDGITLARTQPVIERKGNHRHYGVCIVFRSRKDMTVKYIAHESVHAAKALFEHIGAEVDPHEPFEYLVGWIADCCEAVKKYKPKKKKAKTIKAE